MSNFDINMVKSFYNGELTSAKSFFSSLTLSNLTEIEYWLLFNSIILSNNQIIWDSFLPFFIHTKPFTIHDNSSSNLNFIFKDIFSNKLQHQQSIENLLLKKNFWKPWNNYNIIEQEIFNNSLLLEDTHIAKELYTANPTLNTNFLALREIIEPFFDLIYFMSSNEKKEQLISFFSSQTRISCHLILHNLYKKQPDDFKKISYNTLSNLLKNNEYFLPLFIEFINTPQSTINLFNLGINTSTNEKLWLNYFFDQNFENDINNFTNLLIFLNGIIGNCGIAITDLSGKPFFHKIYKLKNSILLQKKLEENLKPSKYKKEKSIKI
jgi:hypothetical protein